MFEFLLALLFIGTSVWFAVKALKNRAIDSKIKMPVALQAGETVLKTVIANWSHALRSSPGKLILTDQRLAFVALIAPRTPEGPLPTIAIALDDITAIKRVGGLGKLGAGIRVDLTDGSGYDFEGFKGDEWVREVLNARASAGTQTPSPPPPPVPAVPQVVTPAVSHSSLPSTEPQQVQRLITAVCIQCGTRGQVPALAQGKTIRCNVCGTSFTVTDTDTVTPFVVTHEAGSSAVSPVSSHCPYCAEEILPAARICPHCQQHLANVPPIGHSAVKEEIR